MSNALQQLEDFQITLSSDGGAENDNEKRSITEAKW